MAGLQWSPAARAASARQSQRRSRRPGIKVAATYHSQRRGGAKFKAETGVHVYKWDVSNYEACAAGLAQVAKDLGPVDILVNNAGITKDGMFHKMTPDQWYGVINTNLNSLFNMTRPVIEGMREREFGRIDQYFVDQRPEGPDGAGQLFRGQGRRYWLHQGAGAGRSAPRASPSTRSARATSPPKWLRPRCRRTCSRSHFAADPGRPTRRTGGDRPLRGRFWPLTTPASSPGRRFRPMAGSI